MAQLDDLKARAEAARAPCASYWLLVFIYLLIHLFPVSQNFPESGYRTPNTIEQAALADPWTPPQGPAGISVPVVARPAFPDGGAEIPFFNPHDIFAASESRYFDPRGPPATA